MSKDSYAKQVLAASMGLSASLAHSPYMDLVDFGYPKFERNVPEFARKKEQGRNEPCNCGSGKKYKKCCGQNNPVIETRTPEPVEPKTKTPIFEGPPKYIKDWDELKNEVSPTHILEIEVEHGNGWIRPKEGKGEGEHYLSTHTFYGLNHEYSTKLLQSCGFNVILANWDEIGY